METEPVTTRTNTVNTAEMTGSAEMVETGVDLEGVDLNVVDLGMDVENVDLDKILENYQSDLKGR